MCNKALNFCFDPPPRIQEKNSRKSLFFSTRLGSVTPYRHRHFFTFDSQFSIVCYHNVHSIELTTSRSPLTTRIGSFLTALKGLRVAH